MVVIIVAMAVTTRQMFEARHQRDQARFQSSRAEVSIDFLTQLMRLDGGPDGHPPTFHERLNLGVEMLKRQYRDDPKLAGRMLVDLADYYGNDGATARASQLYEQAYELGRENGDRELMVSAQCSRAASDAYSGIHDGNEQRVQDALRIMEQIPNPHVALHLGCTLAQVTFKERAGDFAAAEAILDRAMATRERVDGTIDSVPYATLLTERGAMYFQRGKSREALAATQTASDIYERNGRGRMAAGLSARFTISTILTDMGEVRLALKEREIIWRRLHEAGQSKAEHVAYPVTHGLLLLRMGNTDSARDMLDGIVDRARQAGNPNGLEWALLSAGQLAIQEGRLDEASALLNEVLTPLAKGVGEVDARIFAESYAAELALARSDLEAAGRHRDRFLVLAGYQSRQPHRALHRVLLTAARIALAGGAASDAERFARGALIRAEAKARGPDTSADVGEALLRIAQARLLVDAGAAVQPILERAGRCLANGLNGTHPLALEARQLQAFVTRMAASHARGRPKLALVPAR
jgi:tetratricopeptide (TPR) repeat protein